MAVRKPRPLPPARTLIGAVEQGARVGATEAGTAARNNVRRNMRNPGRAGARLTRRVAKTGTGIAVTVQPRKDDFYLRFVEGGTGVYGPRRAEYESGRGRAATDDGRIRPRNARAFLLGRTGNRLVESVAGQRPQRMFAKARAQSMPAVHRAFEHGARVAIEQTARRLP